MVAGEIETNEIVSRINGSTITTGSSDLLLIMAAEEIKKNVEN